MPYTLRQARLMRDKTQIEMAKSLGVCRDTYRTIEANPEQATIQQAKRICETLQFKIEDIFFGSEIYFR